MKVKFFYLNDDVETLNDFCNDKFINSLETFGDKIAIYYEEIEEGEV